MLAVLDAVLDDPPRTDGSVNRFGLIEIEELDLWIEGDWIGAGSKVGGCLT